MRFDLSLIDTLEFEEEEKEEVYGSSFSLTEQQYKTMPKDDEDINELKNQLSDLFHSKFDDSYRKVEAFCDINEDSFRKYLSNRNNRIIPATALAKFCIGAQVSYDEACELFELSGRILNYKKKFDYIFICELENGADILEFNDTLVRYGFKPIISADE